MTTTYVCTLPPQPNSRGSDPVYLEPQDFVVYDTSGRIVHSGTQGLGFLQDRARAGERIAFGIGAADTHFVATADGVPHLLPRVPLLSVFDKLDLLVREEATMPAVPPATVTFTGPVSGTQDHTETGSLAIGWNVPGAYSVTIEAFPLLPVTFAFTVRMP